MKINMLRGGNVYLVLTKNVLSRQCGSDYSIPIQLSLHQIIVVGRAGLRVSIVYKHKVRQAESIIDPDLGMYPFSGRTRKQKKDKDEFWECKKRREGTVRSTPYGEHTNTNTNRNRNSTSSVDP